MQLRDIFLCNPVRTAIGSYNGSLKNVPAVALGAQVIRSALQVTGTDPTAVSSVVMGNVVQAGNRMNPARQAAISGGLPVTVPALTVNRVCGSGAQAIVSIAQEVWLGQSSVGIAGGMENMDLAPYLIPGGRWGYRMGDGVLVDSMLHDGLNDAFSGKHSGWHTEELVTRNKLSREAQDRWAERSQSRFAQAQRDGIFEQEIIDISISRAKETVLFRTDEANRPDTTINSLAKLKPAFTKDGTITAGNAPGLNSGAAAVIIADAEAVKQFGLRPMARLVSVGIAALDPNMFGLGPIPAIQQALQRANWSIDDVDRFEINEAFAAVPLVVMQELGIDENLVNVDGGAIAHGHPIGATGAVLTVKLLHALQRTKEKRGIVSLCIGGGQGIALAIEAV